MHTVVTKIREQYIHYLKDFGSTCSGFICLLWMISIFRALFVNLYTVNHPYFTTSPSLNLNNLLSLGFIICNNHFTDDKEVKRVPD